jgi:hypothetical protein
MLLEVARKRPDIAHVSCVLTRLHGRWQSGLGRVLGRFVNIALVNLREKGEC